MASFDFPSTPSNGQSYTANGITYTFDGTAWKRDTGAVKGQKGEEGTAATKGQKGEVGDKGQKGEGDKGEKGATGADNSTKGQKGEVGTTTKGQKGEEGTATKGQKGEVGTTTKGQKGEAGDEGFLANSGKTGSYTLVAADDQKLINTNSGVTVPSGVFSAPDAVTIVNNSTGNITITQGSGVSMYYAGSSTTGNRVLAQKGIATLVCISSNNFVISGAGLS